MKAPEICNSNKKRLQHRCFPENLAEFLRIPFWQKTSRQLLLDFFIHLTEVFSAIQWTNRNHIFYIFKHVLSWLSNLMNIMTLTFGKLCFPKQTTYRSSCLHMFFKICVVDNFPNFTGKHLCWSCFLITFQTWRPATLLKRDSNTSVFLWNLWNF